MTEVQCIDDKGCYICYGRQRPHHSCLLALQHESFIVPRVPALSWSGETHKAKLNLGVWGHLLCTAVAKADNIVITERVVTAYVLNKSTTGCY